MVRDSEIEEDQSPLLYPEKNYKERNPEIEEQQFLV